LYIPLFVHKGKPIPVCLISIRDPVSPYQIFAFFQGQCIGRPAHPRFPLLGDKNLRKILGEGGRNLVMREHTWEKTARIIEKTLKETIEVGVVG